MAAALSPSRFIIFPAIFFLIVLMNLIPLYLSPINRNRGILLLLLLLLLSLTTPLSQLNLSETLQTSLPPSPLPNINDSADHGASSTNKISKRFRVRHNLLLQLSFPFCSVLFFSFRDECNFAGGKESCGED